MTIPLTDEERASLVPSGRQTTFANRTHWPSIDEEFFE